MSIEASDMAWVRATFDKQAAVNEALRAEIASLKTNVAVLHLKASLWTIIGAFIATALWFMRELVGSSRR